jgi:hypothetical protein
MLSRGERLDWFGSAEIVTETFIAALAFYVFLAHSATSRAPYLNPRLLLDRNYVIGIVTAVARMKKVTAQETSSVVADSEPCTCGRIATTEKVAALKDVEATTTVMSTKIRRDTVSWRVGWLTLAVTASPVPCFGSPSMRPPSMERRCFE